MSQRILIIEDEAIVGLLLEDRLTADGYAVAAVVSRKDDALAAIDGQRPDGAILDLTLRGERIVDVADRLADRGMPFIIASGLAGHDIPEHLRQRPRLLKPFVEDALSAAEPSSTPRRRPPDDRLTLARAFPGRTWPVTATLIGTREEPGRSASRNSGRRPRFPLP